MTARLLTYSCPRCGAFLVRGSADESPLYTIACRGVDGVSEGCGGPAVLFCVETTPRQCPECGNDREDDSGMCPWCRVALVIASPPSPLRVELARIVANIRRDQAALAFADRRIAQLRGLRDQIEAKLVRRHERIRQIERKLGIRAPDVATLDLAATQARSATRIIEISDADLDGPWNDG